MSEDSATFSWDLANDFPEAEESPTWHKQSCTPKNMQAEDRQSNNEMMGILNIWNQR